MTFLVDDNDAETLQYLRETRDIACPYHVILNQESQTPHLGKFFNRLYGETPWRDPETLVSMTGDDMIFMTPGWDEKVLAAANRYRGWVVIYADDDFIQHEALCVNLFTSRQLVEATGKPFMCEAFAADFLDQVWYELGKTMNFLHYLPEVKIKHDNHYGKPRPLRDDTHRRLNRVTDGKKRALPLIQAYVRECLENLKKNGVGRRRRMVHVLGSLVRGGAEVLAMNLCRQWKPDYEVHLIAVNGDGTLGEDLRQSNIPVQVIFPVKSANLRGWGGLKAFFEMIKVLRRLKPEVVIHYAYHASIWGALAARFAGVPAIFTLRCDCGFMRDQKPLPRWLERLSYAATHGFVAVSEAVRESLVLEEGIARAKIEVIPHGVTLPDSLAFDRPKVCRELELPEDFLIVGMAANFFPWKNQELLVRAAKIVVQSCPETIFVLAGRTGPSRENVENTIVQLGLNGHFRILNEVRALSSLIPIFDIGVLCSRTEGFGHVLLEYMAYGKPVVATRVGGVPEIVESGVTGILVEDNNAVALADAILDLLRDSPRRRAMGVHGRLAAEARFSWPPILAKWENQISQFLAR